MLTYINDSVLMKVAEALGEEEAVELIDILKNSSETTDDDITGFVTPIDDPLLFGKKILRLIDDENMANVTGTLAKDRIKKKFDIKNNVKKTEQIFIDLLEGNINKQ